MKIEDLSNDELLEIVDELKNESFPEDSRIRVLAKQVFGDDSLLHISYLGSYLLPIVATRLKKSLLLK